MVAPSSSLPTEQERRAFDEIARMAELSQEIAISGHTDPDGDALGSNLALSWLISLRWPEAHVVSLLADDRPVPDAYRWLPGAGALVPAARYDGTPDLFVSVDTPTVERLRDSAKVMARARRTASIDHHLTTNPFAQVSVLRDTAAAAGDIIFDLMYHWGITPTREVATCLLCSILTDTGHFQYQNTDAHALRASAELVEAGASPAEVATHVYQSSTIEALRLKSLAMQRLELDVTGRVAVSWVTLDDLERLGARPEDCDSLIDIVRAVRDVDACVFLRERPDGDVRANLRSKVDWLDVASVAASFGGGGHQAAAGLSHPGPMGDARREVVEAVAQAVASGASRQASARPLA